MRPSGNVENTHGLHIKSTCVFKHFCIKLTCFERLFSHYLLTLFLTLFGTKIGFVISMFWHLFGTLMPPVSPKCNVNAFWLILSSILAPLLDPFGTFGEHFGDPTSLVQRAMPHVQALALSDSTLVNIFNILAPSNNK